MSFYTSSFQSEISSTSTNSFSLFPTDTAKEETISSAADESVAEVAEVAAIAEPAMENISEAAAVEVVDIE